MVLSSMLVAVGCRHQPGTEVSRPREVTVTTWTTTQPAGWVEIGIWGFANQRALLDRRAAGVVMVKRDCEFNPGEYSS